MKLIDLKNSGRIVTLFLARFNEEFQEYEYHNTGELEDERILNLDMEWSPSHDGEYVLGTSNDEGSEGQPILERKKWHQYHDGPYIVKVYTPTLVLLKEYIYERHIEKAEYTIILDVMSKSGQFEKEEFTKRNETAINKYCEKNSVPLKCSYTNYSDKCVNFTFGKRAYSNRIYSSDCTELQYIKNWLERAIEYREECIKNAESDIERLPIYESLNKRMEDLKTEIKDKTQNTTDVIQKRFPLLFGD